MAARAWRIVIAFRWNTTSAVGTDLARIALNIGGTWVNTTTLAEIAKPGTAAINISTALNRFSARIGDPVACLEARTIAIGLADPFQNASTGRTGLANSAVKRTVAPVNTRRLLAKSSPQTVYIALAELRFLALPITATELIAWTVSIGHTLGGRLVIYAAARLTNLIASTIIIAAARRNAEFILADAALQTIGFSTAKTALDADTVIAQLIAGTGRFIGTPTTLGCLA